jgi:hypothetical protein
MSQRYRQSYGQGEAPEALVWEQVTWRQGDGRYVFEVMEGGLHAKLSSPHGSALTLPMVAWEGLLDAVEGARKTRTRGERGFPARSGARWYNGEAGELAAAFKAGRTIPQLARAHNRSELAVEAQLDRLGLWDRVARRPIVRGTDLVASQWSPDEAAPEAPAGSTPIPIAGDRD